VRTACTSEVRLILIGMEANEVISGAEVEGDDIHYGDRTIHIDKYVAGIDCQRFADV
jgi:hypothetical protein